eukprot:5624516-Lingulodinium_polyedra.AAC.1
MSSGMHSVAAAPHNFATRALHANTLKWCLHGARIARTRAAPQRRNASPNAFLNSCRAKTAQKC